MGLMESLAREMTAYYAGDPRRIQHLIKVHSFARWIALEEGLDEPARFGLEAAALVHDIGIKAAEEKYGSCNGKLQEQEGPALAEVLLTRLGFARPDVQRVAYLVGRHHTYKDVDGMDCQILLEADLLVNIYEDALTPASVQAAVKNVFRTSTGLWICKTMFGLSPP